MSELVLAGGRVIDETGERVADVRVVDGVIAEVGAGLAPSAGALVLDAEGCVVAPGLVDIQVHFREPGREDAETIETGARAAALGGCTAVVCMPNTEPPLDDAAVVQSVLERGRQRCVRGARRRLHHEGPARRGARADGGALRPRRARVHRRRRLRCRRAASCAARSSTSARSPDRCSRSTPKIPRSCAAVTCTKVRGRRGSASRAGPRRRSRRSSRVTSRSPSSPAAATTCCTSRAARPSSSSAPRRPKACASPPSARRNTSCSPTPRAPGFDPVFKMNPPLREQRDVDALRAGLLDGTIDAIATDHAPHAPETKAAPFEEAPPGHARRRDRARGRAHRRSSSPACSRSPTRSARCRGARRASRASTRTVTAVRSRAGRPANLCVIDPTVRWVVDAHPPGQPRHQLALERVEAHRQGPPHASSPATPPSETASPPNDASHQSDWSTSSAPTRSERAITCASGWGGGCG